MLCFDEFAVHDVADASIVARLVSSLLASGVVIVATSNVEPSRLYEGGRNRDLFLPFIAMLQERMDVLRLEPRRRQRLSACALGHPIGCSGARIMVTLIHALKARGGKRGIATLCIGGGEATAVALELRA